MSCHHRTTSNRSSTIVHRRSRAMREPSNSSSAARPSASGGCSTPPNSNPVEDWSATTTSNGATRRTPDGLADPLAELNMMSSRASRAVAGADRERWQLAGDQLIVDFDLSADNLPRRDPPAGRHRGHRGDDEAAHRLRQVLRAIRHRGGPLGQLPQGSPPARDLCDRRRARHRFTRRPDRQARLSGPSC